MSNKIQGVEIGRTRFITSHDSEFFLYDVHSLEEPPICFEEEVGIDFKLYEFSRNDELFAFSPEGKETTILNLDTKAKMKIPKPFRVSKV